MCYRKYVFLFFVFVFLISGNSAKAQIKICVVAPLTGKRAVFGNQMVNGAKVAVSEINSEGGLLGKKVELLMRDEVSQLDIAAKMANEIAKLGAAFRILQDELDPTTVFKASIIVIKGLTIGLFLQRFDDE